jgi:predicted MFS family arabinose efflux permease
MLTTTGLPQPSHWEVYLPAVLGSFVLMGGLFALERRGHLRTALRAAIGLLVLVQGGFMWQALGQPGLWPLSVLLFLFFVSFNILEASQPSLVSRLAPPHARGAALGVYNTLQSVGLFAGGALGGALVKWGGSPALFAVCWLMAALWLALGWGQPVPPPRPPQG